MKITFSFLEHGKRRGQCPPGEELRPKPAVPSGPPLAESGMKRAGTVRGEPFGGRPSACRGQVVAALGAALSGGRGQSAAEAAEAEALRGLSACRSALRRGAG